MSRRFFRENSQMIAGILVPMYVGSQILYRAYLSQTMREEYEFRTKKDTYWSISNKDLEDLRKVRLILKLKTKINGSG